MVKTYLLNGSIAHDTILTHEGTFDTKILPHEVSRLNVAFSIESHKQEFGGCGANIAYNSALLGDTPLFISNVGNDSDAYVSHLREKGVDVSNLTLVPALPTAHAWIITDACNNQITAFSKGAMSEPVSVPEAAYREDCVVWHLAPEHPLNTLKLAKIAASQGKKYFFDPGQCLPAFLEGCFSDVFSLSAVLDSATGLFLNDYEAELLINHFNKTLEEILRDSTALEFVVKTKGAKGLELITKTGTVSIKPCKVVAVVDPTGCGDALRAGFLHGYLKDMPLEVCAKLGSAMASFAVECSGGQRHIATISNVQARAFESK